VLTTISDNLSCLLRLVEGMWAMEESNHSAYTARQFIANGFTVRRREHHPIANHWRMYYLCILHPALFVLVVYYTSNHPTPNEGRE
jgi:hypothetical protein